MAQDWLSAGLHCPVRFQGRVGQREGSIGRAGGRQREGSMEGPEAASVRGQMEGPESASVAAVSPCCWSFLRKVLRLMPRISAALT